MPRVHNMHIMPRGLHVSTEGHIDAARVSHHAYLFQVALASLLKLLKYKQIPDQKTKKKSISKYTRLSRRKGE